MRKIASILICAWLLVGCLPSSPLTAFGVTMTRDGPAVMFKNCPDLQRVVAVRVGEVLPDDTYVTRVSFTPPPGTQPRTLPIPGGSSEWKRLPADARKFAFSGGIYFVEARYDEGGQVSLPFTRQDLAVGFAHTNAGNEPMPDFEARTCLG